MPEGAKPTRTTPPASASSEAVFAVDDKLNVILANGAANALLGTFVGRGAAQIRPAWAPLIAQIGEAVRHDRSFECLMTPEGSSDTYQVTASACAGSAVVRVRSAYPIDPVIAALGVGRDAIADVLDKSGLGAFVVANSGKILAATPNFAAMLEYAPEDLEGRTVRSITHAEDVVMVPLEAPSPGGAPRIVEKRYVRKSGAVAYVRVAAIDFSGAADERRFLCLACDITAVKAHELAVRQSEWRFRSIVDNMDDLVTIADTEGRIVYVNPAVERLIGYRYDESVGQSVWEIVHPDDAGAVAKEWSDCLSRYGWRSRSASRLRHKDGSWRTFETLALNMLHNPSIAGVLAISHDVTDRLAARDRMRDYTLELEQRNRDLLRQIHTPARHAVSGMVEEIHTPLVGLGRIVELLLGTRLEASQRECLEHVQDSLAHLLRVVEQMLGPTATVRVYGA